MFVCLPLQVRGQDVVSARGPARPSGPNPEPSETHFQRFASEKSEPGVSRATPSVDATPIAVAGLHRKRQPGPEQVRIRGIGCLQPTQGQPEHQLGVGDEPDASENVQTSGTCQSGGDPLQAPLNDDCVGVRVGQHRQVGRFESPPEREPCRQDQISRFVVETG